MYNISNIKLIANIEVDGAVSIEHVPD